MGPLEATKPWQSGQLMGVVRFREKVFNLTRTHCSDPSLLSNAAPQGPLLKDMHRVIKKVTGDIEGLAFNTAISNLMIYTNTLIAASKDAKASNSNSNGALPRQAVETLVLLLSPFAPHVAEECWQLLGHGDTLAYTPWPTFSEELCAVEKVTLSVSVNGKARGSLEVDAPPTAAAAPRQSDLAAMQDQLVALALKQERVATAVAGKTVKKVIYVPGKVLNIIVS